MGSVISKYNGNCEKLVPGGKLTTDSMFAIHFDTIQLRRFQAVRGWFLIHKDAEDYFPHIEVFIWAYVNQDRSYVEECWYKIAPRQHIRKGKFSIVNQRFAIDDFLQGIVNSKAWKYGSSLSFVIEPTKAFFAVFKSSILDVSLFPGINF